MSAFGYKNCMKSHLPGVAIIRIVQILLLTGGILGLTLVSAGPALAQQQEDQTVTEALTDGVSSSLPGALGPGSEAPPVLDNQQPQDPAQQETSEAPQAQGPQPAQGEAEPWDIKRVFLTIWNAELFSAGGSPIELNQIILALLIILLGVWVSKRVALLVRMRISRVQRIDSHAAAVVQTIIFNTLVVIIILAAMPIAGIPTTIFAVLGGAVAIGIGFGAQNLFNNLISGLIMMLERPIRLGDIVEVGEHEGMIEAINNRCTQIRRSDGVDLLIPNSAFLEQPVVNWTLSDRDVRGSVVVGVAYGSPTDKVDQLLRKCVDEHTLIHERPEPLVLFQEFGDNALIFETFFWARLNRPIDLKKIQSDIRFRFDELSRENNISIAFPQSDIHLDTAKPLEIKVLSNQEDKTK